jgi:hypothetical protein
MKIMVQWLQRSLINLNTRASLGVLLLAAMGGCAAPLLDTITATAVARDPMRTQETQKIEMFYPAGHAAAAQRVAARLSQCFGQLESHLAVRGEALRARVILHRGEQNNAYVSPPAGGLPEFMVLPLHEGLEIFNLLNLGLVEMGHVSCHEALHYLTFAQTTGFWQTINNLFGGVFTPQIFLDSWLHEGMATYYESRLAGPVGRPQSALWRGMFEAGVASRGGRLRAGDLSPAQREMSQFGGHYLVGMHFVAYLAETFGEAKLWDLLALQGDSIVSPLGISLRFKSVYGASLEALFAGWVDTLQAQTYRSRPPQQTALVPAVGTWGRLTSCPAQQLLAAVHDGPDQVPSLTVYNADGTQRFSRRLTRILPPRGTVALHAQQISGLSFSGNCESLYFMAADVGIDQAYVSQLWQVRAGDGGDWQRLATLQGVGGAVDPQSERYAYVRLQDDSATLVLRSLRTGAEQEVPHIDGTTSLGAPAFSPDGQRLAFAARNATGFQLYTVAVPRLAAAQSAGTVTAQLQPAEGAGTASAQLQPAEGVGTASAQLQPAEGAGTASAQLHHAESLGAITGQPQPLGDAPFFDYAPRYVDATHLLFSRSPYGERSQAYLMDVTTGQAVQVSDAPFALLDPVVLDAGHIAFLNAEAWQWSIDAQPATLREPVARAGLPQQGPAQALRGEPLPPAAGVGPAANSLGEVSQSMSRSPSAAAETPPNGLAGAPSHSPAAPTVLPPPEVKVLRDVPYRAWEHLGLPTARYPYLAVVPSAQRPGTVGLSFGGAVVGQDSLGYHTYGLQLSYSSLYRLPSGQLSYLNATQAPWLLSANLSYDADDFRQTTAAQLSASRPLWTSQVGVNLNLLDTRATPLFISDMPHLQLLGPGVAISYSASDATAYAGKLHALSVGGSVQLYPGLLHNTATLTDVRAAVGAVVPLPLSRRHTLRLGLRGRNLLGAPEGSLQVGGLRHGLLVYSGATAEPAAQATAPVSPESEQTTLSVFGGTLGLAEAQRGFEDTAWLGRWTGVGELAYRYPLVIDYGWHSFFYVLPSVFVQQATLELWASASASSSRQVQTVIHEAVGASCALGTLWSRGLPVSLTYQLAYRFERQLPAVRHLVVLSL